MGNIRCCFRLCRLMPLPLLRCCATAFLVVLVGDNGHLGEFVAAQNFHIPTAAAGRRGKAARRSGIEGEVAHRGGSPVGRDDAPWRGDLQSAERIGKARFKRFVADVERGGGPNCAGAPCCAARTDRRKDGDFLKTSADDHGNSRLMATEKDDRRKSKVKWICVSRLQHGKQRIQ